MYKHKTFYQKIVRENSQKEEFPRDLKDQYAGWVIYEDDGILLMDRKGDPKITTDSGTDIWNKWKGVLAGQYTIKREQVLYSCFMSLITVGF